MPSFPEEYRRERSGDGRRPNGGAPILTKDLESRRERALERLTEAFAADLIDMEDYERRAGGIQGAASPVELEELLTDLPGPSPREATLQRERGRGAPSRGERQSLGLANRIDPSLAGSQSLACVMGDRQLSGDWLSGDRVEAFTLMGSTKIDLRDTALPAGRVRIEAFVLMGETKIIVPRGLPVRLNLVPFMGEARASREVDQRVVRGEPYLEVSGFALMGSVVVVAMD